VGGCRGRLCVMVKPREFEVTEGANDDLCSVEQATADTTHRSGVDGDGDNARTVVSRRWTDESGEVQ
jgi:hypothetical protein